MKNALLYIIIAGLVCFCNKSIAQKKTYFEIHLDTPFPLDTVCLDIHSEFTAGGNYNLSVDETINRVSSNGIFKFEVPERTAPFYITVRSPDTEDRKPGTWEQHVLRQYLVIPGDNIVIKFDEANKEVTFSGKGYYKFKWRYQDDIMFEKLAKKYFHAKIKAKEEINARTLILSKTLQSLDSAKSSLSSDEYQIMRANIIGSQMGSTVMDLAYLKFFWLPESKYYNDRQEAEERARAYERTYLKDFDDFSPYLTSSASWATFLYHRAWAKKSYDNFKGTPSRGSILDYLKLYSPSLVRDQAIIIFLRSSVSAGKFTDSLLTNARELIISDKYKNAVSKIFEKSSMGSPVEDNFVFTDNEGNSVRISDYVGKNVIVDMWFTGCIPCIQVAKYMPLIEENLNDIEDLLFVSLSVDKNKEDWLKSIDPHKKREETFAYTHYTTPNTKYIYTSGTGSRNSFIKNYNPGGGFPRILIIDKNGKLLSNSIHSPTNEERAKDFEKKIRELIKK
ncbi:TlpA family protein disulfide reductase [Sphingobacterium multivorum]|uniref:TlpA family protein disulfide reductase n=1 Tax=Sphingobacterium multivorum TaxID=28454 RepID=UPI0028A82091|nr:TlpA disulfide reductase family protein [Sphingobacterium multivorum]